MGWNEPEKGKDPWGGKDQPPDLDEALKRFQERLKKALFGGSGQEGGGAAPKQGNGGLLAGMVALILFILWALSGIFIVDPAEQAVILRFGKYVETVGPGPHWIPRIISTKIVHNVERIAHYSYSAQMLTKDENLVSVSLVVQYRIGDLEDYLFNVADPEESLQQTTSSALRQVVGKTTLNQIITEGREAWGTDVQDVLVKTLKKYNTGIVIVNVSPQPARAPESVQDAFDDAIKAREDEKRFQGQALAYQARVVPIAEGNAKRILAEAKADAEQAVLRAKGDVAEFLALLPQYTQAPIVTSERMYFETMQRVLSRSTKVIVDSKAGNLLYLPLDKLATSIVPQSIPVKGKSMAANAGDNEEDSLVAGRQTKRQLYRQGRNE
ncbi:FtsH protease activity modulator HflK [Legionella sp. MW5194]|uniref:FtsH protease activity modulator HflK n=1 Tax=Legionella sp. MW5194 TaxID=2662448 RepID=UPI00193E64B9|nr:FtsH protease activity modulator HflK [Legionella sp. MW5194]QRN04571.1 FtsH protease activity modulator HflK [Legionella sp. MW5194]